MVAVKVEPIGISEIRSRLEAFEARYETPTARFVEAFENGELEETPEFEEWSLLSTALEIASRAVGTR